MEHLDIVPRYLTGTGVEIGAFKTPIEGIKPIYLDRFATYANEPTLADYYGDACDIPFFDSSLQFVATSHVLEHVANPVAALAEWFRVLEHDGIIYMVIPDRRRTFDHLRPLTDVAHMLSDWRNQITQSDGTHIDDFVYGVDWSKFSPDTPVGQEQSSRDEMSSLYRRAISAGNEINIHFHTFESSNALELINSCNLERVYPGRIDVVKVVENFPNSNPIGFLIVAKVSKGLQDRWNSHWARTGLRDDAQKI